MSGALISGPYFIKLIHLPLSPVPDFIYLSPGPDFIKLVRVRILSILSPSPDLIKAVRKASPGPDLINFLVRVRVRVRILSNESRSGFYLFYSPDPGLGFTKYVRVRVRVWILPTPSRPIYGKNLPKSPSSEPRG